MNRQKELVNLALSMVGITEEGGDNQGEWIERFQKAVDGKAQGEPWCCSFTMYLIQEIDKLYGADKMMSVEGHCLYETEHCMTLWNKSPKRCRLKEPEIGCLVIWKFGNTSSGHVGIVTEVGDTWITTVEGNTSDSSGVVREGDGVYKKMRDKWKTIGKMKTVGYLKIWK